MDEKTTGYIKGISFCFLWFFSILSGFYFLYAPILPLMIFAPKLYRSLTEIMFIVWETYATALMEIIMGTKFVIIGEKINPNDKALIIMNHRTRVDWNFLWGAMFYVTRPAAHRLKFVLKSGVRHFPGLGWIMQMTCFLYINRNWNADQHLMGKLLEYFRTINHRCQILLFPEGTDLTKESKAKSDKFAEKHNLEKFEFVLHPKTTGFAFLAQQLRNNRQLDAIYDLSIAYPGNVPQNEANLIKGHFPQQVYFKVQRHDVTEIPLDETGLRKWIQDKWRIKEKQLHNFYLYNKFTESDKIIYEGEPGIITNSLYLSFVFWTFLVLLFFYLLFTYFYFQMWALATTLLFIIFSLTCDGIQHLEISLFSLRKCKEKIF